MDIVFVTAEVAPWSKTGGLGDVMASLPQTLAARASLSADAECSSVSLIKGANPTTPAAGGATAATPRSHART
jgi:hypothetical protein